MFLWQDFYVSNSQISVRNVNPNRPGSFLNGEDGRQTERVNTIGPVAAEEKYVSHEYYNHDKVFLKHVLNPKLPENTLETEIKISKNDFCDFILQSSSPNTPKTDWFSKNDFP